MMRTLGLLVLNALLVIYVLALAIASALVAPLFVCLYVLAGAGRVDDAMRVFIWCFGRLVSTVCWPMFRVSRGDLTHVPHDGPLVLVSNHKSFADLFICGMLPRANTVILVKSWPFRLPVLGWFMCLARYINVERLSFEEVANEVRSLAARGVSCLWFAEGRRSRDGRMQPLRSGAFRIAAENELLVLPVCITGTDQITRPPGKLLKPTRIRMELLSPVDPASFPHEGRAVKLRRNVEQQFRAHLIE